MNIDEQLQLAVEDLVDVEAEALESWKHYRERVAAARARVAALQVEQLRQRIETRAGAA